MWFEYDKDIMSIKKVKEEASMVVSLAGDVERIRALPEPERQKQFARLPEAIEQRISKDLGIKGSLPYEIRDWVGSVVRKFQE